MPPRYRTPNCTALHHRPKARATAPHAPFLCYFKAKPAVKVQITLCRRLQKCWQPAAGYPLKAVARNKTPHPAACLDAPDRNRQHANTKNSLWAYTPLSPPKPPLPCQLRAKVRISNRARRNISPAEIDVWPGARHMVAARPLSTSSLMPWAASASNRSANNLGNCCLRTALSEKIQPLSHHLQKARTSMLQTGPRSFRVASRTDITTPNLQTLPRATKCQAAPPAFSFLL